ncbi:DUF3885 domain-containing protein [Ornithinibacillus xuwenensis]|uniref:DUF3885 domain-containing protein n=1 Tax=Ornithinibacillus xuwenensis TaxID=3144668 RepID=A0ABU9XEJ3_9BACI
MELYNQLRKRINNWMRFELGLVELADSEYFKEIQYRAKSIFNFLFNDSDTIWLVATVSNYIDNKEMDLPHIKRFLRNEKLIYTLQCTTIPYEYGEEDIEMRSIQYSIKVNKSDIRLDYLTEAISNKDFARKPKINDNHNLSFVNETKGILFHMYDDRGCDVFSSNKDILLPLYQKYRKWILDYNRVEIDNSFKRGLFNYYETTEEKVNRLDTNEQKVKETKINLFQVNTCSITHSLEIPSLYAEECVGEISETGFKITYEEKNNNSTILNVTKTEALALVDYQTELMSLYSKKYKGVYKGWSVEELSY